MKQKLLEMDPVTVLFHTDEFILFGISKTEIGAETAPRVPKLGYFDGRVPKLSSRVTLATYCSPKTPIEGIPIKKYIKTLVM